MTSIEQLAPSERADLVVAASRAFSAWLRVNLRLGMRRRLAILRANERTAVAFGVDFLADAGGEDAMVDLGGVPHGLRASAQHPDDLIERGSGSAAQFAAAWCSGQLALPFAPCGSEDLFGAYQGWCRRQQLRAETHQTLVGVLLRLYDFRAFRKRLRRPGEPGVGLLRSVLAPIDALPPGETSEGEWLGTCVDTFRRAAFEFAATT